MTRHSHASAVGMFYSVVSVLGQNDLRLVQHISDTIAIFFAKEIAEGKEDGQIR